MAFKIKDDFLVPVNSFTPKYLIKPKPSMPLVRTTKEVTITVVDQTESMQRQEYFIALISLLFGLLGLVLL